MQLMKSKKTRIDLQQSRFVQYFNIDLVTSHHENMLSD